MMKCLRDFFAWLLILIPCTAFGVLPSACKEFQQRVKTEDLETVVVYMIGALDVSGGEPNLARQTTQCLIGLWAKKDGAGAFAISDGMVGAMTANTSVFLEEMVSQGASYSDWLSSVSRLSFTWRKDPPCPLNGKRDRAIEALERHMAKSPGHRDQAGAALKVFRLISCRQIN